MEREDWGLSRLLLHYSFIRDCVWFEPCCNLTRWSQEIPSCWWDLHFHVKLTCVSSAQHYGRGAFYSLWDWPLAGPMVHWAMMATGVKWGGTFEPGCLYKWPVHGWFLCLPLEGTAWELLWGITEFTAVCLEWRAQTSPWAMSWIPSLT